ncbi:hypothetical protein LTR02_001651 [Friedmanniomyces endolithicus]|nr:hypothetical protein LTR94_002498 [Friedmanniomyces endolithicus]KAK0801373.1 hypothetical protein LTR59_005406 [Friedmanniomyces endolithicus]KAK0807131.1 hypothetical protein LTR38_004961 [Friedmanniomyces endolithicus]KAK0821136.1 hypothetical protein LTR75_000937 [Friedmanniomyces endolithicus]KAK0914553.1 hypothetical protein LTR02_001651 [Friedmanniomyces endolithicus]
MFGRKKQNADEGVANGTDDYIRDAGSNSDRTLTDANANDHEPSKAQIKRATRARFIWALIASFFLLLTVVFLILVEVGNTSTSSIRTNIYFIKLDLTNIIPVSVPNAELINSIAQTLGLHDFYMVGLWGFCEGYNGQGVTQCSTPQAMWWFNPVQIIQSELLSGASIALPSKVNTLLGLIRVVSHWMFALFLTGACLSFLMMFLIPLSIYSRWATLPIMIFTFLAALFTTVASVIATVLFVIMQNAITSVTEVHIGAKINPEMFAFIWIASGSAIIAWIIQLGQCCCCASRRDVKKGKKRGSKKAWTDTDEAVTSEKPPKERKGWFGAKK